MALHDDRVNVRAYATRENVIPICQKGASSFSFVYDFLRPVWGKFTSGTVPGPQEALAEMGDSAQANGHDYFKIESRTTV